MASNAYIFLFVSLFLCLLAFFFKKKIVASIYVHAEERREKEVSVKEQGWKT
jgi:hypothetical protein